MLKDEAYSLHLHVHSEENIRCHILAITGQELKIYNIFVTECTKQSFANMIGSYPLINSYYRCVIQNKTYYL